MNAARIKLAAEGHLDLAVLRRLASDAGFVPAEEYGMRGKAFVDSRLVNWNKAAQYAPWLVMRDLDQDANCAGQLVAKLLPAPSRFMCFRVAVREVEGWILADRNACLEHLGFKAADIPQNFDVLTDAKLKLLTAARRASKAGVREGLVAVSKSGSLAEGDTYNAILTQFVTHNWRPRYAERSSVSLKKARVRLAELAARAGIR